MWIEMLLKMLLKMFIENSVAVDITMSSVKTKAAIFRSKFGVNQRDIVLRKQ